MSAPLLFPAVTTQDFLNVLFKHLPADSAVAVARKRDLSTPGWKVNPYRPGQVLNIQRGENVYYCVSGIKEVKPFRRIKQNSCGLYVLMLDDINTKVARDLIKMVPTYCMETSQGNFQLGFLLDQPVTDLDLVDRVSRAVTRSGLSDPGAGCLSTRLARALGSNTKRTPLWTVRLTEWRPDLTYRLEELIAGLGLELDPPRPQPAPCPTITCTMSTPYGQAALRGMCSDLSTMEAETGRNVQLNRDAYRSGQLVAGGELVEHEALEALRVAALACGLELDEIDATIESGFRAGLLDPRQAPDGVSDWNPDEGQRATSKPSSSAVVLRADSIRPESILWIWDGYLAAGKLHILGGAPGTGKTTLAIVIAAIITRGGRYPDGCLSRRGSVLIWSGEDDPADTIVPRLAAAGADLSKVHILSGMTNGTETRPFDPALDMAELVRVVHDIGDVRLIVVDPVVSAVQGDSHKNAEVRRSLQPLVTMGAETDAAILGITHFSKGSQGRDATERIVGSIAFAALARVVMVAAKRQDQDGAGRVFARAKSNIGSDRGGFAYDLEQVELSDYPGVYASRVTWGDAIDGDAREILAQAEAVNDADDDGAMGEAMDFIHLMMNQGPVAAKAMQAAAREAGVSSRTLARAKKKLGITSQRVHGSDSWQWTMPTESSVPTSSNVANLAFLAPFNKLNDLESHQGCQNGKDAKSANNARVDMLGIVDGFGVVEVTI